MLRPQLADRSNRNRRASPARLACVIGACFLVLGALALGLLFLYGDRIPAALGPHFGFHIAKSKSSTTGAHHTDDDPAAIAAAAAAAHPDDATAEAQQRDHAHMERMHAYQRELEAPTPAPRACPPDAEWRDGLKSVLLPYDEATIDRSAESAATAPCGLRYQFFVLHSANWNLTRRVLRSVAPELPKRQLVLIDATLAEETRQHAQEIADLEVRVVYPKVPLSLAAGMEFIRRTALAAGLDFVLYSHNDALFLRAGVVADALAGVCRYEKDTPAWGVLTFHYDIYCAYNMKAFLATGMWDPYIPNYKADFDYYRRMQCAGYRVIAYDKPEPGISVLHERSMTFKTLAQQGAEHRYGWWLTDEVGRYLYFWAKWNTDVHPWIDPDAFVQPWDGQAPPDKTISAQLLLRFAWRYHWPLLLKIVIPPYAILVLLTLRWAWQRCACCCRTASARPAHKHAV